MIHTVGDSHSRFGWSSIDGVVVHHVGPKLLYTFSKNYKELLDINNFGLQDGDSLVFCFGEIDCRNHIHTHSKKIGYEKIISNLVKRYVNAIKDLTVDFENIKIAIYMIPPPASKRHGIVPQHHLFPERGTEQERLTYVKFMNLQFQKACEENGFLFVDVYDDYSDEDGFIIRSLADEDSYIHIGEPSYLENQLKQLKML